MTQISAYRCRQIFDGYQLHRDATLVLRDGRVLGIGAAPDAVPVHDLGDGILAPGLVDLQVNGGGGQMLNDGPSPERIAHIAAAHLRLGTTSILPTLITAPPEMTTQAIAAARTAGGLGLHLEGPHLDPRRKGAHRAAFIREMSDEDCQALCDAAGDLSVLMVTLAPETVRPDQAHALRRAGVVVSLGHSDCSYEAALAMQARCATHLFNAMSQLGNRAPGLVGAVLDSGALWSGLIADGVHVAPATIRAALRAKTGPGQIFLVSDAMATVGSQIRSFTLDGRVILRGADRLTLEDGTTLAGADVDLLTCVRVMRDQVGLSEVEALRMATLFPAQAIGQEAHIGTLAEGAQADMIYLRDDHLTQVWKSGEPQLAKSTAT